MGNPGTMTFSYTGTLPSGVSLDSAGLLSGTPTAAGSFTIVITASNGVLPNATQTFTLTVDNGTAPAFTSSASHTFTVGAAGVLHRHGVRYSHSHAGHYLRDAPPRDGLPRCHRHHQRHAHGYRWGLHGRAHGHQRSGKPGFSDAHPDRRCCSGRHIFLQEPPSSRNVRFLHLHGQRLSDSDDLESYRDVADGADFVIQRRSVGDLDRFSATSPSW